MAEGLQSGDEVYDMAFANHLPNKTLELLKPLTLRSGQACSSATLNFTPAFCFSLLS